MTPAPPETRPATMTCPEPTSSCRLPRTLRNQTTAPVLGSNACVYVVVEK